MNSDDVKQGAVEAGQKAEGAAKAAFTWLGAHDTAKWLLVGFIAGVFIGYLLFGK